MRVALVIFLLGCGAAAPAADASSSACEASRAEAQRTWSALAEELARPAPERAASPIDGAVEQLGAHVAAVREHPPEEVDGQTALAVSGAVMDAIDALTGDVPAPLRARVDDAAEALLTDRTPGGSVRAAREAAAALEAALRATDPVGAEARAGASARESLRRRAQSAADGYGDDPRAGDRSAARAERVEVSLEPPGLALREAAVEASRQARVDCRFSRGLAVPSM
ncbi:MAG: hypothetical protein H6719_22885 [Sandaracinaceae bacterium]|nr:hypothetical protein [Sandaracinaceae bacterium]